MSQYFVTAWCDRLFTAKCEVEAESPEEALTKAREAINEAPAEECDGGYPWDEWRVDTAEVEGVLLHQNAEVKVRAAAAKLLEALIAVKDAGYLEGGYQPTVDMVDAAISEAKGLAA